MHGVAGDQELEHVLGALEAHRHGDDEDPAADGLLEHPAEEGLRLSTRTVYASSLSWKNMLMAVPADASDLLARVPIALGAFDRNLRWAQVNPALAAIAGVRAEEMVGRRPSELLASELGPRTEAMVRRVLATGQVERTVIAGELDAEPGVRREWEVTGFALPDGVGVAVTEITQRRRAEDQLAAVHRRDALLARAGQLLSTALSVQETADLVARLAVPEIADWCFVELLQEDGGIERVAMAHRDPAKLRWVREVGERYPLDRDSPVRPPKVIRTGQAELIPDVPGELVVAAAQDAEHLRLLREIGFSSACVVPLKARGRILGDIALATASEGSHPPRRYGPETLALAEALADLCALALDNAMLYARRDLVAVSLQEELLPRALPDVPGIDVAARYAAAGEGNDVGGDFYDLFAVGRGWLAVIGDVVGKGPAAAAVTGLARHTIRAAAAYEEEPSALLRVLNDALLAERAGERLASVACVRLEATAGAVEVTISCAGHPLALIVGPGGVRDGGRYGQLLGVSGVPPLHDVSERLAPGDVMVLYTDGVSEARGPGGIFGEAQLRELVAAGAGEAPSRVVERIERAVLAWSGGRPRDDLAVVALRVRPRSATR